MYAICCAVGAGGFVLSKKWEEFAPWSSSKDPYAQASGPTWVDFKSSHYYVHARLKKRGNYFYMI